MWCCSKNVTCAGLLNALPSNEVVALRVRTPYWSAGTSSVRSTLNLQNAAEVAKKNHFIV